MLIDDTTHDTAHETVQDIEHDTENNTVNNTVNETPTTGLDALPSKLAFLLGSVVTAGSIGLVGSIVIVWRLLSVA